MMDLATLNQRISQNYKFKDALKIMRDSRTLKLNLDLNVFIQNQIPREEYSKTKTIPVYNWLKENVTDIKYISNTALVNCGLHSFGKPLCSPHRAFETFLLIPDDDERMMFKLKFIDF
jgi:cobalamin biosynthesis Mg chelatase CobN